MTEKMPENKVAYVNVYDNDIPVWFRETRELADKFARVVNKEVNGKQVQRIACVKIEYQHGQFDN